MVGNRQQDLRQITGKVENSQYLTVKHPGQEAFLEFHN
jgi:hypothetical protein